MQRTLVVGLTNMPVGERTQPGTQRIPPRLLDLEQEISPLNKLHDVVQPVVRLEAGVHFGEVRVHACLC